MQGRAAVTEGTIAEHVAGCRSRKSLGILLPVLAFGLLMQASAGAAPDPDSAQPLPELDEVVVEGNHLWQIRMAIADTEARFYSRFNDLNSNNDFDVYCSRSARLGTRISRNSCLPAFLKDAMAEEAIQEVNEMRGVGTVFSPGGYAETIWLERYNDYRKNALDVINGDRELRVLIRRRDVLERQLEARRKEIFKDRWISW
jgi:hypothetical protein